MRAALLSVAVSLVLLALKFVAYFFTDSAAILSDAAESVVNVLAANVALFSLVVAARPPDEGHQYGHGKAEYVSSSSEGAMILVAGLVVIVNAGRRLVRPAPLEYLPLGVGLVALAAMVNYLVARWLLRISRHHDSAALEADARHLFADVATSVAVIIGLGVQVFTGLLWVDPVAGLLVGGHIARLGLQVYRSSLAGLMDTRLPEDEEAKVRAILADHADKIVEYHALRSRKAGRDRFIDLHLVLHRTLTVGQAHALCDDLESHIHQALPHTDVTIHVEPAPRPAPTSPPRA